MDFIREQGVVGLAIGFLLGGSVSQVAKSLVEDIINPLIGLLFGSKDALQHASFSLGTAQIIYGNFLATLLNFVIIAFVVYYVFKGLGLDKIDKKG